MSNNTRFKKYSIPWNKNKIMPEEHRAKLRKPKIITKPRPPTSLETRKKQSLARMGKSPWNKNFVGCFSEEAKKKIGLGSIGRIPWNKGKKGVMPPVWSKGKKLKPLSIEQRKKISEALKGSKAPNWKGGITKQSIMIRESLEYRLWREAVFARDNWTCIWCGVRSAKDIKVTLNADHIKPFADYPELRFSIDNGRTLCVECHYKTHTFPKNLLSKKYKNENR